MTTISVPEKLNDFEKKFNIRPIRKGDVLEKEAVVALVNRCYRSSENWCNESKIVQGVRISMSGLEESLRNSEVLIVEDQSTEKVVACVKTGVTNETVVGPMPEPTGYIGMFAVSPDYQSRGLGTHLMTAAERFCENKGMMKMVSDIHASFPQFTLSAQCLELTSRFDRA